MLFLLGEADNAGLPMYYFTLVYVIGFIAAVGIGSIAWYNSKRPAGWEDAQRPDFVPKVNSGTDAEDQQS